MSASLNAYDDHLDEYLTPFIKCSNQIGDLVDEQCRLVADAFKEQRKFIESAQQSCKPSNDTELMRLIQPMSQLVTKIQDIKEKNRKHEHFNHLAAVAEGIGSVGWITVQPTPAPYVKEMCDSAQFYTNKVLMAFKDNPQMAHHVDWAKSWIAFLTQLQKYIRQHHTTGLVWAKTAPPPTAAATGGGAGGPPPPPPPPCGLDLGAGGVGDRAMDDARAALFASINQGADITKGLRKVTADQMTHKNPSLRAGCLVPEKEMKNLSMDSNNINKQPMKKLEEKLCLEGKKWVVENFTGRYELVVDDTHMQQSVNIYQCNDCVLTVKGKVNSITVDKCKKVGIVFDGIVSFVEFINSKQIKAQAMDTVPTITIDFCDGVDLFLGEPALTAEIISSKSSSINVSVPGGPDGDYVEHSIPEQLKSTWAGKSFKTVAINKN